MKQETILKRICVLLLAVCFACNDTSDPTSSDDDDNTNTDPTEAIVYTIADALAANQANHEVDADYTWSESDVITITLNGTSITVNPADAATINGSTITITKAATYSISGTLADGQVIVDTEDETTVRLIFNGVDISNSSSAPVYIASAEKTVIVLADNTTNILSDAKTYVYASADEDEPNAALFSKGDLTIYGNGSLTVKGNYNDAIASKDGLLIKSGTYSVTAADDGIRGKDYLIVENAAITINASGDGLKSDNDEEEARGYILVEGGTLKITAGGDALQAETDALIAGGDFTIVSGGGSSSSVGSDKSAKGLKGGINVITEGGTFSISSADDAVHSNGNVSINDGTFTITSGDDGMHADTSLGINGGEITITKSYEGIESALLTITDGTVHVTASDDGINGAGGNDGSSTGGFTSSSSYYLYIYGGYIYVDATGDGIDVNGSIVMTDGVVIVNGPTANNNAPIDYDQTFKISGGFIAAAGSSGMAQIPGTTSTQNSVLINLSTSQAAGSLIHIQAGDGTDVVTFKPTKKYQSFAFSSPNLATGSTYDLYLGGSSSGTVTDGLYSGGSYTAGTKSTSFTISSVSTKITK
ncbi:MAG TPA: carbohydrate-binding domain-containing protein [Ohtaekwangia sp.]|uniref:carbohydrate-binding domain-containing protein n=1 Tax=Ohtaekwangia sp. TaxID=2066019 RepID=UPI002F9300C0